MVKIVSTIYGDNLLSQARLAQKLGVDILEIRFDLFDSLNEENVRKIFNNLRREINLPIISTIRIKNEGGKFRGNESLRLRLFKSILDITDYIDIELESIILDEILKIFKSNSIILSYHNFKITPEIEELMGIYRRAKRYDPWLVKIVTRTERYSDLKNQVVFLEKCKGDKIAIFGMGSLGWISRLITPYFGTELIYGHLKHAVVNGQPPVYWLISYFRSRSNKE